MHYGLRSENVGQIGERVWDWHEKLIGCYLGHDQPLQKIHQNLFITFQ